MKNTLVQGSCYDVMNKIKCSLKNGMIRQQPRWLGSPVQSIKEFFSRVHVVVIVIFLLLLRFFSGQIKQSFGVMIHSLSI